MVFPGIFLFGLDKILRIVQSRPETCILAAKVFPSKAIELILPKDPSNFFIPYSYQNLIQRSLTKFFLLIAGFKYTPTSVVFMKIPSISKIQWHSFSIISSSSIDDDTLSVLVKCEGSWTSSLYDMIQADLHSGADQKKCIPIGVEGPYGPASVDFLGYRN